MKKVLVALTLSGAALTGLTQQSQAQGMKQSVAHAQVDKKVKKDTTRLTSKKEDSGVIELSPVAVPVVYSAGTYSPAIHYPRLQSTSIEGLEGSNITPATEKVLKQYITSYYSANNKHLQDIQAKSTPYFTVMTKVLNKFGIPQDLKYLAVIESGLNTHARSRVGAVGAWQFMASTARLLGLKVNAHQDDRKNLYKSTVAAAKYLSQLHAMFGDWKLVIAAYNCGPGRLQQAINSSGSNNFWELKKYLPHESQKHVMKFLATSYIMNRFAHFFGVNNQDMASAGFSADNDTFAPITQPLASIAISGKYSLAVAAKYISMNLKQLEQLNPGLMEKLSKDLSQTHYLYLPADKMILFKDHQDKILNESISLLGQNNVQQELAQRK